MNWKTVLQLVRVDMKSTRLLRGQRLTKYNVKRNRLFSYLPYVAALAIGIASGILVLYVYSLLAVEASFQAIFSGGFLSFQFSLPTLILVFTFIFSMMQQIQRSGVSFTRQAPYWLPVTWQEHTLASILSDVLGLPLLAITLISPIVLIGASVVSQVPIAVGSVFAMLGAALMATATTEVFRILQVRFTGAVYRSTGRAAVWIRFVSSLLFFIIFYAIYFSITSGANTLGFIQAVASAQSAIWFVPFVWLGMTVYSFVTGLFLQGIVFLFASALFVVGLFYIGTWLNSRFGLYEPPAITISRGLYAPKTGILGKFGFSSVEAALLRKDFRAFTRRRELISAFIIPIVFLIIPIMSSANVGQADQPATPQFWFGLTTLFPVGLMVSSLGSFMTGEEGQNIWRIYSSPISAKNYVRSKLAFVLLLSFLILPITAAVGFFIYHPTMNACIALLLESVFVAFPVGALSLANGIKGADFTEVPRPRMIRAEWSLISMFTCAAVALAVLMPLLPAMIASLTGMMILPILELYQALILSGVISAVLTVLFHKMAIGNAQELLTKAEV
jgi:hypothetical protein